VTLVTCSPQRSAQSAGPSVTARRHALHRVGRRSQRPARCANRGGRGTERLARSRAGAR